MAPDYCLGAETHDEQEVRWVNTSFKVSDWLIIGGAAVFLILGMVLDWAKLGGNAFDWARGWISLVLVIAAAVIVVLRATGNLKADQAPWDLIVLGLTALATLLMLLLVITGPDKDGVDLGRGIGLWVSFIATVAALVGAGMKFAESGGKVSDLTDRNTYRGGSTGSTGGYGGTAPPPPPPPGP